jgi:hypothetical protein
MYHTNCTQKVKRLLLFIVLVATTTACTKEQDGTYNGIRIGVSKENYYRQIDSLININKLAWKDYSEKRVAYSVQTLEGKPLYLYLMPIGGEKIESLRIDAIPSKVPITTLTGLRLMGDFNGEPPYTEIDAFLLNQLKEKYGDDYQEDSTQVVVDSAPIISFDSNQVYVAKLKTKLWNTENYKISMKHYVCQHAHKISILYVPIIKNSNQF